MRIEKLKYTYNLRTNVFLSPFLKKGYFCPLLKEQFLMQNKLKLLITTWPSGFLVRYQLITSYAHRSIRTGTAQHKARTQQYLIVMGRVGQIFIRASLDLLLVVTQMVPSTIGMGRPFWLHFFVSVAFQSSTILEAYLINSLRFSEV